jgi:hypothetical protein
MENGSKMVVPVTSQKSWLDSVPAQRVLKPQKRGLPPHVTLEETKERQYEEQRAIWAAGEAETGWGKATPE